MGRTQACIVGPRGVLICARSARTQDGLTGGKPAGTKLAFCSLPQTQSTLSSRTGPASRPTARRDQIIVPPVAPTPAAILPGAGALRPAVGTAVLVLTAGLVAAALHYALGFEPISVIF